MKPYALALGLLLQAAPQTQPPHDGMDRAVEACTTRENLSLGYSQDNKITTECLQPQADPPHDGIPPAIEAQWRSVVQDDDPRVEVLSPDEYDRLQQLRKAVTDAEREIALAHWARVPHSCATTAPDGFCLKVQWPDRWEFRGHFLLINVPEASH